MMRSLRFLPLNRDDPLTRSLSRRKEEDLDGGAKFLFDLPAFPHSIDPARPMKRRDFLAGISLGSYGLVVRADGAEGTHPLP